MKMKQWMLGMAMVIAAVFSIGTRADAIAFSFKFPTIPYPPKITSVSNTPAVQGAASFKVSATFEAQPQNKAICPLGDPSLCGISDWQLLLDDEISPNPPDIKKAWVYYFSNGNPDGHQAANKKVEMTYNATKAQYEADIPIDPTLVEKDTIQYYIVVVDSRGNVTSEEADPKTRPCPSISSWVQDNATPKVSGSSGGGSCDYATGYQQCAKNKDGKPSGCTDNYTLGSPANDTCGEPAGGGDQGVVGGQDKIDIRGLSGGADGDFMCLNLGIGAPPPPTSDPSPIEGYIAFLINPDTADSNPNDTYLQNAYAITFAPEAAGSDPTLVKVLWDGECATRPKNDDLLGCRLFAALSGNTDLEISYENGLKMKVKRSGTGTMYVKPYNLMGSNSKMVYVVTVTGEINLSGANTFWFVNVAQSLGLVANRHETTVASAGNVPPDPCSKVSAICSAPGATGTSYKCPKSGTKPASNTCKLTLLQANSTAVTKKYKIYRRTDQGTPTEADFQSPEIAESGASSYTKDNTVTTLEGNTYYYTCIGLNADGSKVTEWSKATKGTCIEEDWKAPAAPDQLAAATPKGSEGSCSVNWHFPVASDNSIYGFVIDRNDVPLNPTAPVLATSGVNDVFNFADPSALTVGTQYTYTVWSKDLGGNLNATKMTTKCTAENLKSPAKIDSLSTVTLPGLKAKLSWNQGELVGSYDVYKCKQTDVQNSCLKDTDFDKLGTVQQPTDPEALVTFPTNALEENRFCFYIDAADKCNTEGTCPSNAGQPNRSGFPSGGAQSTMYVKCLMITDTPDNNIPDFPAGQKATVMPEGKKCKLEWNKTTTNNGGAVPFGNTVTPEADDLVGYKVFRALNESVGTNSTLAGLVSANANPMGYTDSKGLSNGTTYYYRVYAYDGRDNLSTMNPPTPVSCRPMDTTPPATPTVVTPMTFSPDSCTVDWAKVTDPDSIVYNVYRCTGAAATCNASSKFAAPAVDATNLTVNTYEDSTTERDTAYTYCVTAKDPAANENSKFTGACGSCTPSNKPTAPTGVIAAANSEGTGITIYWTASSKDTGDYSGLQGYYIYRCKDAAGADCGAAPVNSAAIQRVPTMASPHPLNSEPAGDNYYAVTYTNGDGRPAGESGKAFAQSKITITAPVASCPADPCTAAGCNFVISAPAGTLQQINTALPMVDCETGKCFASVALSGVSLRMYDMKGAGDTDDKLIANKDCIAVTNGGFSAKVNPADVTATDGKKKIKIVLEAPLDMAQANHFPCDTQKTDPTKCLVTIMKNIEVKDAGGDYPLSSLPQLPGATGGGKEVGNIYCDTLAGAAEGVDPVDMGDFNRLKQHFGTEKSKCVCPTNCTSGQGKGKCYAAFADINGDGLINMVDYGVLKTFFKKSVSPAPTVMPKDADGNDLCTIE